MTNEEFMLIALLILPFIAFIAFSFTELLETMNNLMKEFDRLK